MTNSCSRAYQGKHRNGGSTQHSNQLQSKALVVKPNLSEIDPVIVKKLIDGLIPINVCRRHRLVPLAATNAQPSSILIGEVAVEEGMKTLLAYSLDLVRKG